MTAKHSFLALASSLPLLAGGCGLDFITAKSTIVQVVSTHHGTADEDGEYPDLGTGNSRLFETDEGWSIHLTRGYITTTKVVLEDCDGLIADVELTSGHVAEDLTKEDRQKSVLGSLSVPAVDICGLTVDYGRFDPDESEQNRPDEVEGTSVYLEFTAIDGETRLPFEVSVTKTIKAELDMSTMSDGAPFRISGTEAFPVELVIAKTYDRFFDGIDFRSVTEEDLEEQLAAALELSSSVTVD